MDSLNVNFDVNFDATTDAASLTGHALPPDNQNTPESNSGVLVSDGLICPELKVDRLTLITDYDVNDYPFIQDGMMSQFGGGVEGEYEARRPRGFSFAFCIQLRDSTGALSNEAAHISFGKANPEKGIPCPRVRVDWNPNLAGAHGTEYIFGRLHTALPGGANQFLAGARVSRIDHAVDIPVWADHVLPSAKNQQCAQIITDRHGDVATMYIGRRAGDKFLRAYQKAPSKQLKQVLLRLEYQTRNAGPLVDIGKLKNPFAGLTLYHITDPDLPAVFSWFVAAARQRGVKRALEPAADAERKKIEDFLSSVEAKWWNTTALWEHWEVSALNIIFGKPWIADPDSHPQGQVVSTAA